MAGVYFPMLFNLYRCLVVIHILHLLVLAVDSECRILIGVVLLVLGLEDGLATHSWD